MEAMVLKLTPALGEEVAVRLITEWKKERDAVHPSLCDAIPEEPSNERWEERYYAIMTTVLEGGCVAPPEAASDEGRDARDTVFGMDPLLDETVSVFDSGPAAVLEWLGGLTVLEPMTRGANFKYEGWLIEMDTQTRDVQAKDDKKREGTDAGTIGSKALGFVLRIRLAPRFSPFGTALPTLR